jgi:hypothetical protein
MARLSIQALLSPFHAVWIALKLFCTEIPSLFYYYQRILFNMNAGFEYIYLILIVGYYLYKAFGPKKKVDVPTSTAPPQKKKTFLEEILEQIEEQNQPKPAPKRVPQSYETAHDSREVEQNTARDHRAQQERREDAKNPYAQRPTIKTAEPKMREAAVVTSGMRAESKKAEDAEEALTASKSNIRLGKTVLSPRDAVVAQILFERRF